MGYAERVLQPGERIVYRARLHWIMLAPGVALTVLSMVVSIVGAVETAGPLRTGLLALSGVIFAVGGYQLLQAWFRRMSTEIIVSDRRIIVKTGLVARNSIEMNLDKVESVMVRQSVLGRMLDYGALVIRGVGAGLEPVANVAAPLEFHRHVNARG